MNRVKKSDTKCSKCGLTREKMEEMLEKKSSTKPSKEEPSEVLKEEKQVVSKEDGGIKIDTGVLIEKEKEGTPAIESVLEEEEKKEKEKSDFSSDEPEKKSDPESGIDSSEVGKVVFEDKKKRHKHKSKLKEEPKYTVDENGDYNIDTSDVTFLEGVEAPTYSVKKARGEVKEEKLKWWEIYKWADRMLAKRKIMKEVNKASTKTPFGISRGVMIFLCIFFGYMGAHSLYGKNYKRGFTTMGLFITAMIVVSVPVLYKYVGIFLGGGCGFVAVAIWVYDLVMLVINKYKYRISKEEFISNLNVETRAKIGKKYVDLDRSAFKDKERARVEKIVRKRDKKNKHERK